MPILISRTSYRTCAKGTPVTSSRILAMSHNPTRTSGSVVDRVCKRNWHGRVVPHVARRGPRSRALSLKVACGASLEETAVHESSGKSSMVAPRFANAWVRMTSSLNAAALSNKAAPCSLTLGALLPWLELAEAKGKSKSVRQVKRRCDPSAVCSTQAFGQSSCSHSARKSLLYTQERK
jgi:hypothetical protein